MYLLLLLFGLLTAAPVATIPPPSAPPPALYLSTDLGVSWDAFTDGLPSDVQARNVLEHHGNLYLSTVQYGIFVLPAGACAWQSRSTGFPLNLPINTISTIGDRILLGSYDGGVYVSDDEGAHWRRPLFNVTDRWVGHFLFHNGVLYAGTDGGIWTSADRGDSWQRLTEDYTVIYGLAIHDRQIFVARQNGMGILQGKKIVWFDVETETAIGPLLSLDGTLYAQSAAGEVICTKDGSQWEHISLSSKAPSCSRTTAMQLTFFRPTLPGDLPGGSITETSRGWVVGLFNGC